MLQWESLLDQSKPLNRSELEHVQQRLQDAIRAQTKLETTVLRLRRSWIGQGKFNLSRQKSLWVFTRQGMSPLQEIHLAATLCAQVIAKERKLDARQCELVASALCLDALVALGADRGVVRLYFCWFHVNPATEFEKAWNGFRIDFACALNKNPNQLKDLRRGKLDGQFDPVKLASFEELRGDLIRIADAFHETLYREGVAQG